MNIYKSLIEIGFDDTNCVVIGSGVLSALGLRDSNDIDVVTDIQTYNVISKNGRFTQSETYGREILVDDLFEIGTSWGVLGKNQTLADLMKQSVVINGVRYITIEFLLAVKKSWLLTDTVVRQKDVDDVSLIEDYLANQ